MIRSRFQREIELAAIPLNLNPDLVEALVLQESGDDPWAWNPEPTYRYLWDNQRGAPFRRLSLAEASLKTTPPDFYDMRGNHGAWADHEWAGQQASWGLLQIMGAVARERGFTEQYLTSLCDPRVNLDLGCHHLRGLLNWAQGETWQAVAAYNGGRGGWRNSTPQEYAAQVHALFDLVREDNLATASARRDS